MGTDATRGKPRSRNRRTTCFIPPLRRSIQAKRLSPWLGVPSITSGRRAVGLRAARSFGSRCIVCELPEGRWPVDRTPRGKGAPAAYRRHYAAGAQPPVYFLGPFLRGLISVGRNPNPHG